jgi:hypothetical protein
MLLRPWPDEFFAVVQMTRTGKLAGLVRIRVTVVSDVVSITGCVVYEFIG